MRRFGPSQAFHRGDRFAADRPQRHRARCDGMTIDQHEARAALFVAATETRALELQRVAENVK